MMRLAHRRRAQESGVTHRILDEAIGQGGQHAGRQQQEHDVVPCRQRRHPAALGRDLENRPVPQVEREGDETEEREWSACRSRSSTPHFGAVAPAAMTRPAARVGMATSAPGYWAAGVKVTRAHQDHRQAYRGIHGCPGLGNALGAVSCRAR